MTEIEILKSENKSVKHNFEILKLKVEDMTKKIENVHAESTSDLRKQLSVMYVSNDFFPQPTEDSNGFLLN